MIKQLFPEKTEVNPTIYAYEDTHPQYKGLLKVGYTTVGAEQRVAQQYPTIRPGQRPYNILLEESAMKEDGTVFSDHDVHRAMREAGLKNLKGEWFECTVEDVKSVIISVRKGEVLTVSRDQDFNMRPEQSEAVKKTISHYSSYRKDNRNESVKPPHFLWNAKMRFGKTFTAYQLAKKLGWKKILVLTFKPAVQNAWEEDLNRHIDFEGWQFIKRNGQVTYESANKNLPIVCFGSFQDYLGRNIKTGGIKTQNEWVHATHWDCVIFDEYHFGAWRENAKDLFEAEDDAEIKFGEGEGVQYFDQDILPITTDHYLYLSGTPFRAIASGEFIEEQIFNWTYSDEQRAKKEWEGKNNPYLSLPRMVMLTYQMPEEIREIAMQGEFNEFDLNEFFSAIGEGDKAAFKYNNEVQKWLNLIRGGFNETIVSELKLGTKKPPMPFSDARLLDLLSHTFWFLPSVASCYAMKNLLEKHQNKFYHDYEVIVAAGKKAGIGAAALPPVEKAMCDPLKTKTITLSCGKLTTGVTVKPWAGILMLRNSSSPETYFQAAFRVQSPWTIKNADGVSPNKELIIKNECYVFDFSPNRALKQVADYSCRLNIDETSPEQKVAEFISFLPVLAYDGSSMKQIDAAGILDIVTSGTSASLLARRWESALLVNVDNETLARLMSNTEAMSALANIEGFRNLNQDLETIINKSEAVKKAKRDKNDEDISKKEKKELSEAEKEYKSLRKKVQDKLIKFATRIPVFMYLTDHRERTLKDVITQLEPDLFRRVTGLTQPDFELLVSLGVFNSNLMNDAIYKFKRYEDASLNYTEINKHDDENIGLWDTTLSASEAKQIYENVQ